jgi:hypothetical protein
LAKLRTFYDFTQIHRGFSRLPREAELPVPERLHSCKLTLHANAARKLDAGMGFGL